MPTTVRPRTDLYRIIHRRRDVREGFNGAPVPGDMLDRVLAAAHAAPSVGLSQPWDFIVVRDAGLKRRSHTHVDCVAEVPDLERHGWRSRSALASVVNRDRW